MRNKNLIAGPELRTAKTLCDKIYGFRGAAGQYYFRTACCIDEFAQFVSGAFVCVGCPATKRVYAAVYVGMVLTLVAGYGVNDDRRLLCGCRAVEVSQWLTID